MDGSHYEADRRGRFDGALVIIWSRVARRLAYTPRALRPSIEGQKKYSPAVTFTTSAVS